MPTIEWNRSWAKNLIHHMKGGISGDYYGDQWGDPEKRKDLIQFKEAFVTPFVKDDQVALEIGSGGGRWTQYLLPFSEVICVEINPEMFGYLKDRFGNPPNLQYVTSHGWDIPFVPKNYVDYAMSFGVFVHLDVEIIENYVSSLQPIMKKGGNFVVQFSNKRKPLAANNPDFSDNNPEKMTKILESNGFQVKHLDDEIMDHSSIIRAIRK